MSRNSQRIDLDGMKMNIYFSCCTIYIYAFF